MAAPDIEPHQPPSKTPRQLVIVLVLAFTIPVILVLLLANLATTGMRSGAGSISAAAVTERIRPVAQVNVGQVTGGANAQAGAGQAQAEKTGEQVFQSTCAACHQTGAAGAPKVGDKAAWGPRIARGEKSLMQSALHGKGAMPAKGGNADLSDAEVERALVYMANQAGAKFKESPAAAAGTPSAAAKPAAAPASPAQPSAEAKGGKSGEEVVQSTCAACHQTGAAGAPKIGDKAAWGPRIARGEKALLESALHGKGAMPAKGGNAQLSDVEVERALIYMADKAGAPFKEAGAKAGK